MKQEDNRYPTSDKLSVGHLSKEDEKQHNRAKRENDEEATLSQDSEQETNSDSVNSIILLREDLYKLLKKLNIYNFFEYINDFKFSIAVALFAAFVSFIGNTFTEGSMQLFTSLIVGGALCSLVTSEIKDGHEIISDRNNKLFKLAKLKDEDAEKFQKILEICKQYLKGSAGLIFTMLFFGGFLIGSVYGDFEFGWKIALGIASSFVPLIVNRLSLYTIKKDAIKINESILRIKERASKSQKAINDIDTDFEPELNRKPVYVSSEKLSFKKNREETRQASSSHFFHDKGSSSTSGSNDFVLKQNITFTCNETDNYVTITAPTLDAKEIKQLKKYIYEKYSEKSNIESDYLDNDNSNLTFYMKDSNAMNNMKNFLIEKNFKYSSKFKEAESVRKL